MRETRQLFSEDEPSVSIQAHSSTVHNEQMAPYSFKKQALPTLNLSLSPRQAGLGFLFPFLPLYLSVSVSLPSSLLPTLPIHFSQIKLRT